MSRATIVPILAIEKRSRTGTKDVSENGNELLAGKNEGKITSFPGQDCLLFCSCTIFSVPVSEKRSRTRTKIFSKNKNGENGSA